MADTDTKQDFQWLDIPNAQGVLERKWCKDAEARAAIEALPSTTVASVETCRSIVAELT